MAGVCMEVRGHGSGPGSPFLPSFKMRVLRCGPGWAGHSDPLLGLKVYSTNTCSFNFPLDDAWGWGISALSVAALLQPGRPAGFRLILLPLFPLVIGVLGLWMPWHVGSVNQKVFSHTKPSPLIEFLSEEN